MQVGVQVVMLTSNCQNFVLNMIELHLIEDFLEKLFDDDLRCIMNSSNMKEIKVQSS